MAFDLYMYGGGLLATVFTPFHRIEPLPSRCNSNLGWWDGPLQIGVWKCDWSTTVVLLGAPPTLLDPRLLDLDGCIIRAFCGFVSIHTWAVYLLAEASIRLVIGKLEPV